MKLNVGKFKQNGNCGYVLKPNFLRNPNKGQRSDAINHSLKIKIISAQNLPKTENDKKDIVDPYVSIKVVGHPADKFSYKTKVVPNNGTVSKRRMCVGKKKINSCVLNRFKSDLE